MMGLTGHELRLPGSPAKATPPLTLLLPLPPKELNPNQHVSYWRKAEEAAADRSLVHYLALEQAEQQGIPVGGAHDGRFRMTETYLIFGRYRRDIRNLFAAFKAGEDGLVDSGLIPGDDDKVLSHGAPSIERVTRREDDGVRVTIEGADNA